MIELAYIWKWSVNNGKENKNMEYRIPPGTEAVEKLEDFIVVNRIGSEYKNSIRERFVWNVGSKQNDTENRR